MVSRPNKVVKRTSGNAERLAPSLHTLATEKALKILDVDNGPFFVLAIGFGSGLAQKPPSESRLHMGAHEFDRQRRFGPYGPDLQIRS